MIQALHETYLPKPYLFEVAKHCPLAMFTYLQLWERKDVNNRVKIEKETVKTEFLTGVAKFRNDLLLLVKEGLASIDENPSTLTVELVGYDPNFDATGD